MKQSMKQWLKIGVRLLITTSLTTCLSYTAWADPFYCTETNQYINPGMNIMDVRQACGKPQSVQKSKKMQTTRIPVTQLTFNISTSSTRSVYGGTVTPGIQSGAFQINTGPLTTMIVNVTNNQINSISLNGESVQSVSLCGEGSFGIGDSPTAAINSCGSPTSQNNTYKNVNTGNIDQVETWTYQPSDYQPSFKLVFVNGILTQVVT